jgi:hypothetical protein
MPDIENLRFRDNNPMALSDDFRAAYKGFSIGRSQEIDFKFDCQNLKFLSNGRKGGISGSVIRHRGHHAGMDKTVLLSVMLFDLYMGLKKTPLNDIGSEMTIFDESTAVVFG